MRLAVLGDIHGRIDAVDVEQLDGRGYDAILVTGDLAGYRPGSGLAVARVLAQLTTPTYVIPGNHDAATLPQLGAEVLGRRTVADALSAGMEGRVAALRDALGPARLCAYERVDLGEVQLVAARPHSFGGPVLNFAAYLSRAYGVTDLDGSAARVAAALAACDGRPVVVLAHCGPTGLGDRRIDPFGRDFHRDEGDWGDPDLAAALDGCAAAVRVVVAGHMHHALSGGGTRRTVAVDGARVVVNAARVPRIDRDGRRHHVAIEVGADAVAVDEVWQTPGGARVRALARWDVDAGGRIVA